MDKPTWDTDSNAKELRLNSIQDFLLASAINPNDEKLWYDAGGEVREWPEERRLAWQNAIEKRVCYLYEEFYKVLNFSLWNSIETDSSSSE
jgi:hypothetical protein